MALIGIDARLLSYRRGIGNFVYNLLTELAKIPGDERYILYVDDDRAKEFAPQNPRFTVKNIGVKIYPLWEQISLPLTVGSDGLDILHCPANTAPLFLPKRPNLILTIHDVMYLLPSSVLPKASSFYQRAGRIYYCKISPLAAKRAVRIMTISGKSKMDIIENLHIEPNKIQVVYLAGNAICQRIDDNDIVSKVMRQFAITGRYVFALGALDPRKNTENILRSFARMKQLSPLPIQLVLAGLSAEAQKIFHSFISKLGLNGKVILLGFVTELELTALYNGADVFLYPSLYEGFGMPVIESFACGTPVVTSSTGSIPEVAGNAARFVDPQNPDEIANAVYEIVSDPILRDRMIRTGIEQASRFSWIHTAKQVLEIYRSC